MSIPAPIRQRLMIGALPLGMLLLWLSLIARGDGRLDALGNPVGSDFAMFYIAGNMASQGQWHLLYDEAEQQRRLLELFPGLPADTYLPYRYPPLLAILLAPLGSMPYRTAQCIWCLGSLAVWLLTWLMLARTYLAGCSQLARTVWLALLASPIMAQTLIDGQASFWWFAILSLTWLAIDRKRLVLAGMCLALAACKPNVLLLLGIVFVVRHPRMLLGVIPMGLLMLATTVWLAGLECLNAYIELGSQLATRTWSVETPYWKVQSLLSWSQLLLGSSARTINLAAGIGIALAIGFWWRACERELVEPAAWRWWPGFHRLATVATVRRSVHRLATVATSFVHRLATVATGFVSPNSSTGQPSRWSYHAQVALTLGLLTNALFNPYTPLYDLMLLSLGMFGWLVYAERAGCLATWIDRRENKLVMACCWAGPIVSQCLARELACPQQWMSLLLLLAWIMLAMKATQQFFSIHPTPKLQGLP